jgi:hypothetical protein
MSTSKYSAHRLLTIPYRKIKDIKLYTVDEGKKVNESLKAYQERYDQQMTDLVSELNLKHETEKEY